YFYQWLQRYRTLHQAWASTVLPTIPSSSTGGYRPRDLWERLNPCQDLALKQEFAYAKTRWFDERAPSRLDLTEEMRRSVLDISNLPPQETGSNELTHELPSFPNQPSPSRFDVMQIHVLHALRAAFNRFLRLAFCNGGLWHACVGHTGSMLLFLMPGLAMWFWGAFSGGRRELVGVSLPLIWLGLWFMLMTATGHCFIVYATGDARQLYPHEFVRPLPADLSKAPPIYSLDLPPQPEDVISSASPATPHSPEIRLGRKGSEPRLGRKSSEPRLGRRESDPKSGRKEYEQRLGRKGSETHLHRKGSEPRLGRKGSALFSLASSGGGRRGSGGILGVFGRKDGGDDDEEMATVEAGIALEVDPRRTLEQTREMDFKLPPARKTKDISRQSFGLDAPAQPEIYPRLQVNAGWDDEAPQLTVTTTADIAEYRFTEAEDFGIIISEAYEEDEEYRYPYVRDCPRVSVEVEGGAPGGEDSVPGSSGTDQPMMGVQVQVEGPTPIPEGTAAPTPTPSRCTALPDIFSFASLSPTAALPTTNSPTSPSGIPPKSKSTIALDWALSQAKPATSRRGSKQWDAEGEGGDVILINPKWRTMFGPMTLVHDPLVRRAHWAITVRSGVVASVVVCGMALGLIR
ncbi:hypothetical protein FRC07_009222, partial [Ceratobasidium sp. 392]